MKKENKIDIITVAIKFNDLIFTMPKPNRHPDVLHQMHKLGIKIFNNISITEGFLTSEGHFLNRLESYEYAMKYDLCNDIPEFEGVLYSEDLW